MDNTTPRTKQIMTPFGMATITEHKPITKEDLDSGMLSPLGDPLVLYTYHNPTRKIVAGDWHYECQIEGYEDNDSPPLGEIEQDAIAHAIAHAGVVWSGRPENQVEIFGERNTTN